MIKLTEKQRQELRQVNGDLVRVLDPTSRKQYVLVPADAYLRIRELLEAEVVDPSLYEFEEIDSPRS